MAANLIESKCDSCEGGKLWKGDNFQFLLRQNSDSPFASSVSPG